MPTSNSNLGQVILDFIKTDALTTFGKPLLTFLTAVEAANGDKLKEMAAVIQLQGNLVAAAPTALGEVESQIASALAAKLQAAMSSVATTGTG